MQLTEATQSYAVNSPFQIACTSKQTVRLLDHQFYKIAGIRSILQSSLKRITQLEKKQRLVKHHVRLILAQL